MRCELTLNGERRVLDVPGLTSLAVTLREHLGLIGTKVGCAEGWCGACAVLVDGAPAAACLMPTALVDGCDVRTIEGISPPGEGLSSLQTALLDSGAVQCGFCTPGLVVMLTALLDEGRPIDEAAVRGQLGGTLCRCSCFGMAVEATLAEAACRREELA